MLCQKSLQRFAFYMRACILCTPYRLRCNSLLSVRVVWWVNLFNGTLRVFLLTARQLRLENTVRGLRYISKSWTKEMCALRSVVKFLQLFLWKILLLPENTRSLRWWLLMSLTFHWTWMRNGSSFRITCKRIIVGDTFNISLVFSIKSVLCSLHNVLYMGAAHFLCNGAQSNQVNLAVRCCLSSHVLGTPV